MKLLHYNYSTHVLKNNRTGKKIILEGDYQIILSHLGVDGYFYYDDRGKIKARNTLVNMGVMKHAGNNYYIISINLSINDIRRMLKHTFYAKDDKWEDVIWKTDIRFFK